MIGETIDVCITTLIRIKTERRKWSDQANYPWDYSKDSAVAERLEYQILRERLEIAEEALFAAIVALKGITELDDRRVPE